MAKKDLCFWNKLPKPFFALAPMANVTDSVFRKIIAKYGKPDVMWTEFVSADGLISAGKKKLLIDLKYSNKERPIVAQLFTGHSEVMREAAKMIADLGFDGLDINMGCPDRAVEKQGGGAAMMKNQELAIDVLNAAREGVSAPIADTFPPISVKTRLGYNNIDLNWIRLLLEQKLPALTIHLRTRREMSDAPAHWEIMPDIIKLRNEISTSTLIIGNGDVESVEDGISKCKEYSCDGVMIGRGIFGKPWLFSDSNERTAKDRLKIMLEHAELFEKTFKGIKNFAVIKKHFKAYVSGWDGAKELRVKLMGTKDFNEVRKVVKEYLSLK
ncbi:MAG: tRNA-dihydrouridine synthase [Patescibacteria group bacterium]